VIALVLLIWGGRGEGAATNATMTLWVKFSLKPTIDGFGRIGSFFRVLSKFDFKNDHLRQCESNMVLVFIGHFNTKFKFTTKVYLLFLVYCMKTLSSLNEYCCTLEFI
jgi:hypothetical protein